MTLQRLPVVFPVVAEDGAALVEPSSIPHQPVPVVMTDLVPEVADQRPVGLAHLGAPLFALGVVSLRDVDGDEAVVMAGQHLDFRALAINGVA